MSLALANSESKLQAQEDFFTLCNKILFVPKGTVTATCQPASLTQLEQ